MNNIKLLKESREALKWADTYIKGYLPDLNTMSHKEVIEYEKELVSKVELAINNLDEYIGELK